MASALLRGSESFSGQIELAAWTVLRHTEDWKRYKATEVYCHGVFLLPGDRDLLVLVSYWKERSPIIPKAPIFSGPLLHPEVINRAAEILNEHRKNESEFEDALEHQRPVLTADLLPFLPKAATFRISATASAGVIERSAIKSIADSNWPPARDATYTGLLDVPVNGQRLALVTWEPYSGPPSYPEVRWAVQRRLPRAFKKPLLTNVEHPKFESIFETNEYPGIVTSLDSTLDLIESIADLNLDEHDYRQRVDNIRQEKLAHGFEAIAWFQPYHAYTEDTWGIYFDARKLDDLALSLMDDFQSQEIPGWHGDAARLAFGLVYAHEVFHAKVEAATSWLEVNALQPRHLRYTQRVYDATRETSDWLEEALANWAAWDWFRSTPIQLLFAHQAANSDSLQKIVESSLDLSPPGYRDWRVGHQSTTWRTFATQLSTGQARSAVQATGGLPLESALLGPFPYDFRTSDIPLRFIGSGIIADHLQSNPATFNVPTRRELEKALKYFKHVVNPAGGKGGHQKWTGPDNRAFILPTRDPVSVGVFKTFLQHLEIDKVTYVREVRPNL